MYDELVKALHDGAEFLESSTPGIKNSFAEMCHNAADAIEELTAIREEQKAQIILMAAEIEEKQPRWISVTERLPEEHVFVLIRQDDDRMMVAERVDGDWWYRYFAYDVDRWDENEQGTITHWQPLPEPPKEE